MAGRGGAVRAGRAGRAQVDAALALHAWPYEPVGHVAVRSAG